MTQEKISEGNKLIGEFMGKKFKDPLNFMYDKSWDWLMSVIEKIKEMPMAEFGKKKPVMNGLMDVDIKILWLAVIEFINWYNNQQ